MKPPRIVLIGLLLGCLINQSAIATPPAFESPVSIQQAAESYAVRQARSILGAAVDVKAHATPVDARLRLGACADLDTQATVGSAPWGRATVEVSCPSPRWRIFVAVAVSAQVAYPVAAITVGAGHQIEASDIAFAHGDIAELPSDVVVGSTTVVGRKLVSNVKAGRPFRNSSFARENAITAGQHVKLVASAPDFSVSTEGTATSNAADGEPVRAVGPNGKQVSGLARSGGTIEVTWK